MPFWRKLLASNVHRRSRQLWRGSQFPVFGLSKITGMGSTRRDYRVIYLRANPEKHAALLAYASQRGWSVTGVVERLIDELLRHEVLAAPRLKSLEDRLDALENRHA